MIPTQCFLFESVETSHAGIGTTLLRKLTDQVKLTTGITDIGLMSPPGGALENFFLRCNFEEDRENTVVLRYGTGKAGRPLGAVVL